MSGWRIESIVSHAEEALVATIDELSPDLPDSVDIDDMFASLRFKGTYVGGNHVVFHEQPDFDTGCDRRPNPSRSDARARSLAPPRRASRGSDPRRVSWAGSVMSRCTTTYGPT